jgi:hypothetical protein
MDLAEQHRTELEVDFRYRPAESWTAICHADDEHKTLVRGDGALLYGYRRSIWNMYRFDRTVEFTLAGEGPPLEVRQGTQDPTSALVETSLLYESATVRLLAFRHWREGRAFDVVRWEIENSGGQHDVHRALQVEVFDRDSWFTSGPEGASHRIYAAADPSQAAVEWWYDRNESQALSWSEPSGSVLARSYPQPLAAAQPTGFRPVAAFSTVPVEVSPGGAISGLLVLPLDGADVEQIDDAWLARSLAVERAYWKSLVPDGLPIEIPDPGIQSLLEASARNILQARALRGETHVFEVGPTLYRDFWVADGYFMLEAVRYMGLGEQADEALAVLETHVQDDGSIVALQDVGHSKETAIAIAMVVRQAELAGDLGCLDPWWETIARAVEHIARLHASTYELPQESPCRGLMPPAFPDGGVAGRRCEYTTMLWCLAGLRAVADMAEFVGRSEACRFREVYLHLRTAFMAHADAHREPLSDGHRYLPMVLEPGAHHTRPGVAAVAPEDQIRPETATWAFAHAIYPGQIFQPDDSLVQDYLYLLDLRDDDEQIPASTGWLPHCAVWSYYASFAAHAFLWAGDPHKAVEYLYGFANHAAPTGVWREEQALRGSGLNTINGDMPHNWASAEFIRLVRNLLVFERGDDLRLLPGLPEQWLRSEAPTRLTTPTRFGRVDLLVRADDPVGLIEVVVAPGVARAEHVTVQIPPGEWRLRVNDAEAVEAGPSIVDIGDRL